MARLRFSSSPYSIFLRLLGLGTVLLVYKCARLLWPTEESHALLAASLVAFLPQFNFIHSAVTNDALITFLASLGIWQLLRLWLTAVNPKRLLYLGITIGLAALTKNAGILLLLYALGVLFLIAIRDWDRSVKWSKQVDRWVWETAVFVILPVLLISGWLWVRNQLLYGDLTAANQFVAIAGGDRQYTIGQVLAESEGLWLSFIGIFGWFNLRPPEWVFIVWNGIAIVGGLGAFFGIGALILQTRFDDQSSFLAKIQQLLNQSWLVIVLLFIWFLGVYGGLVAFMLQTEAAQGRLLFPAIVPIILAFVFGITRLKMKALYGIVGLAALVTTVYCLFFVIRPAYAFPQVVAQLPAGATVLNEQMPFGVTLVGSFVETETAVSNDIVWYTLYWRKDELVEEMPTFKFEILGRDLENPVGEIHTFHGRGLYPPNVWPMGEIVADRFPIRLDSVNDAPVLARGFARLVRLNDPIQPANATGVSVGAVKIIPEAWAPFSKSPLARLGDEIELTAVTLPETAVKPSDIVEIQTVWQANGTPATDYATLVHLGDPAEPPLAQGDAHPRNGTYPTRIWREGEVIHDQYQLAIPVDIEMGCYPLLLGMYAPDTFERLPLLVDGVRQTNDVYQAGEICINTQ